MSAARSSSSFWWSAGLCAVLLLALALRLHGIGSPIMDHPGWRQGDTAAIARNFALRQFNILYPQTTYNGPPPNYVELELQIVPFIAATLYKIFGVHEIFGRLVTLAFSLATVAVVSFFGRWMFTSALAGLVAGCFYAFFPGSVYYGRTFTPDCAMVFFLTGAIFVAARMFVESERIGWREAASTTALLAMAYLAKPVAVLALAPLLGLTWQRRRTLKRIELLPLAAMVLVPIAVLWLYDRRVASYAEWHWASGITRLHVLPSLAGAFASFAGFVQKCTEFRAALGMLRETMLGWISFLLTIAGFAALPWLPARSRPMLWMWLAGGLAYAFIVVSVERVDYYLFPLLPLCALVVGGLLARFARYVNGVDAAATTRYALIGLVPLLVAAALLTSRAPVAAYYEYNRRAYSDALQLDRRLAPGALVVMGHYGPDLQYYIGRFGWEEDPLLWTPFDEESAIAKGARYFISVEDNRLHRNVELCAWLQRFPLAGGDVQWPVYLTSPQHMVPNADAFWRAFRRAERAGHGRAFLDAQRVCQLSNKTRNASGDTAMLPR
ncbi:MAG: glycosyltransferase family 39 protein [Candidatus Eremiobacteraeota bacterium]|nr:glycosyltransferase family 39 protein [Candidatus Eremiobacteraeota bacterium]